MGINLGQPKNIPATGNSFNIICQDDTNTGDVIFYDPGNDVFRKLKSGYYITDWESTPTKKDGYSKEVLLDDTTHRTATAIVHDPNTLKVHFFERTQYFPAQETVYSSSTISTTCSTFVDVCKIDSTRIAVAYIDTSYDLRAAIVELLSDGTVHIGLFTLIASNVNQFRLQNLGDTTSGILIWNDRSTYQLSSCVISTDTTGVIISKGNVLDLGVYTDKGFTVSGRSTSAATFICGDKNNNYSMIIGNIAITGLTCSLGAIYKDKYSYLTVQDVECISYTTSWSYVCFVNNEMQVFIFYTSGITIVESSLTYLNNAYSVSYANRYTYNIQFSYERHNDFALIFKCSENRGGYKLYRIKPHIYGGIVHEDKNFTFYNGGSLVSYIYGNTHQLFFRVHQTTVSTSNLLIFFHTFFNLVGVVIEGNIAGNPITVANSGVWDGLNATFNSNYTYSYKPEMMILSVQPFYYNITAYADEQYIPTYVALDTNKIQIVKDAFIESTLF